MLVSHFKCKKAQKDWKKKMVKYDSYYTSSILNNIERGLNSHTHMYIHVSWLFPHETWISAPTIINIFLWTFFQPLIKMNFWDILCGVAFAHCFMRRENINNTIERGVKSLPTPCVYNQSHRWKLKTERKRHQRYN